MKRIFAPAAIAILIIICLNSCKKDEVVIANIPTEFPKATELLPMANGNYWVFFSWDYDRYYKKINSTLSTDSLVVVGTKQIEGKTAWIVEHYSKNTLKDSLLFNVTDSTILRYMYASDSLQADIAPRWVTIYHKGYELDVDCIIEYSENKPFFDTNLVAQIRSGTQVVKDFDSVVTFAGKQYKTIQMIQIKQYIELFDDSIVNSGNIKNPFKFRKVFYQSTFYNFYPNIGFMGIKTNPYYWSYLITSGEYNGKTSWTEYFNGKLYSLIRYKVQ